jgi:hypothetical protein
VRQAGFEPATRCVIYTSLIQEIRFASGAVDGTYTAIGPHLKQEDAGHVSFYTQVEPAPFTEMIASACVIAQLELLKSAAYVLGWASNEHEIRRLLAEARELNEASANPEARPEGSLATGLRPACQRGPHSVQRLLWP